jgi:hypothetical protein
MLNGFCIGKIPKAIVCVSDGISSVMKEAGFPSEKIAVIHSAVDASAYDSTLSKWEARKILGVFAGISVAVCDRATYSEKRAPCPSGCTSFIKD